MTGHDDLRHFWGKARPAPGARHGWHPLICHSLDVAAIGERLLAIHGQAAGRIAARLGWEPDALGRVALFFLALHDIGKLSLPFQAKVPELWPARVLGPLPSRTVPDPGHGAVGLWLARDFLRDRLDPLFVGWRPKQRRQFMAPFFGHHGRPVVIPNDVEPEDIFDDTCLRLAGDMVDVLLARFAPPVLPVPDRQALHHASWWLAGLAVLADWLGSWQAVFAYEPPPSSLGDYWVLAQNERAVEAIERAGLAAAAIAPARGLADLTGKSWAPSPVQLWAETVELPDGPVCVFIEDMTGGGKTETALILAHRLMAMGQARGLYVALPTMATANAMYERLSETYRRLFAADEQPSLALAHGRATLHSGFRRAVDGLADTAFTADDPDDHSEGDASNAACAAWLASESRKAFLADIGVGTIDQALLAVLPAKFQSLRLFGLAGQVLVIDEAHAYDAYMNEELARLLEFQAALGGSAVVLSATLPEAVRAKLAAAFRRGLGADAPAFTVRTYPRVTLVSTASLPVEKPLSSPAGLGRKLAIERLDRAEAAFEAIAEAASKGAAVAWVRNTVDDAIEAAETLRGMGYDVTLFHARMAMGDRLGVEREVVARFGKKGDPARRAGIVVATQVIEQSLDLDFDLMVSDLAPIDLLLQRAGRLWRHMALWSKDTRAVSGPRLLVLSPDPAGPVTKDWLSALFPRAGAIYSNHALLWKTANVLFVERAGTIRVPEDVRAVVEAVYSEAALDDIPPALRRNAEEAEGECQASRAHAWANLLTLGAGYDGEHGGWQNDVKTPTRLGEEQITLRLARIEGGGIVPWCHDPDPRSAWVLSEVSVRRTRIKGVPEPTDREWRDAIERTMIRWPEWEREAIPILVLERASDGWRGMVEGRNDLVIVFYSSKEGLRFG